jgi:hypothetical protein
MANMTKLAKVILILSLLVFVFVPTLVALKWIAWIQIYDHFVATASNLTGFNINLIKAAVLLALVPFLYAIKLSLSINKRKRQIGVAILLMMAIGYNFGLFFATREAYFSARGEPLRYFALTPDGVKYSDRPGVDRIFGIPFQPVTPDKIHILRQLEKGAFRPVDPSGRNWFNPITGAAELWYYRYPDGGLEFYDKKGRHPFTNEPLLEVTKELYLEWRAKQNQRPAVPSDAPLKSTVQSAPPQSPPSMEVEATAAQPSSARATSGSQHTHRIAAFNSLIYRNAPQRDKSTVCLAIESDPLPGAIQPALVLRRAFAVHTEIVLRDLGRIDLLKSQGFLDDLFEGDQQLLASAAAQAGADFIIVGRLDYSFQKSSSLDPSLVSCNVSLNYRLVDNLGNTRSADGLSARGAGFSEPAALENALSALSNRFVDRVRSTVGR